MLIRPATLQDLDSLKALAEEAGVGMTTLPASPSVLKEKIELSLASFSRNEVNAGEDYYLFVLEETEQGALAGCCSIIAAVGMKRPFYSFRIIKVTHTSQELDKYEPVEVLQMVEEYRGSTEIATLYVTPDYRKHGNGKFLSRSRFLFLAEFPQRFSRLIIAEIRGVQDTRGHSAFWDNLGRHFIPLDFSKAEYLSSLGKYQFIADMMPKYPIYIRLLPKAAQAVIGISHEASRPAMVLLEREGFRFEGCVDVFDAGPTIHCPLDQIATVRESRHGRVDQILPKLLSKDYLISTTQLVDFRICRGHLRESQGGLVQVSQELATMLQLQIGDTIRFVKF
jgi:arginine N-succinyltransferase